MTSDPDYQPISTPEAPLKQEPGPLMFGRYEVASRADGTPYELGRGGMGVTYKAMDPALRRTVALKVINPQLLGNDSQARARFRREARSAAGVQHHNIATIFDIGEERLEDYYVMEFIAGEDVLTRITREGPFATVAALQVARQVAAALDAACAQGIVHRDIKPANLMIAQQAAGREAREGPMIKVVDFGLAKAFQVAGAGPENAGASMLMTSAAQSIYSPAYASPEQIEEQELDIRSDLYSLGVSLWQLLTGTPPFGYTSKAKTIVGHLSKEPPFGDLRAGQIPEAVVGLLDGLLKKSPADRLATPEIVLEHIDAILAELTRPGAILPPVFVPVPGGAVAATGAVSAGQSAPPVRESSYAAVVAAHAGQSSAAASFEVTQPAAPVAAMATVTLLEVLRRRGTLAAGEVLRLLDVLAPQVDEMQRVAPSVSPDLEPAQIILCVDADAAGTGVLAARPLDTLPAFTLRLGDAATFTRSQPADQTMPSNAGGFRPEDPIQAVGALVYELLDGKLPPPGSYRPLAAINEAANAVLRDALESEGRFRTAGFFAKALRNALKDMPTAIRHDTQRASDAVAPAPGLPPGTVVLPHAGKRHHVFLWVNVAVGAALLALYGWHLRQTRETPALPPPAPALPAPTVAVAAGTPAAPPAPPPVMTRESRTDQMLDQAGEAFFACDWNKTVELCENVLALEPDSLVAYARRGSARARMGDLPHATEDWNKAVSLPIHETARDYSSRGSAYYALGQTDKALADYDKALTLDPQYAIGYNNRGNLSYNLGQFDKAIADYNKAIALNPDFAPAYNNRGNAYRDSHDTERALSDYDRAIELNGKDASFFSNRGTLYAALNHNDKALADYDKAIEIDPKNALLYGNRGTVHASLDQKDLALADYSRAIELDPKHAKPYYTRGFEYFALGETDKAMADYGKAIEIDPKCVPAYYNRGYVYYALGKNDKAMADYNKLIEIDPKYAPAYNSRGYLYYNLGQTDKAIADYNKAIEIDPKNAKPYYNLCLVYTKLGDVQRARQAQVKGDQLARGGGR